MKIELSKEQVNLILDGLDALAEAAESENRVTQDPEVMDGNEAVLRNTAELYEYIANYKEGVATSICMDGGNTGEQTEEKTDQEGICPVCGGELKYTEDEPIDDGGVYHWICTSCEATGKEGYDKVFDGHHYEVCDADGNRVPGRDM